MPNHLLRIPRALLILLFILVATTLLVGTFRTFLPARAQADSSPTPLIVLTDTPTVSDLEPLDTPPADTNGIIAQAIILVAIVIFGAFWGWRMSFPRRHHKIKE